MDVEGVQTYGAYVCMGHVDIGGIQTYTGAYRHIGEYGLEGCTDVLEMYRGIQMH